jgi:hypothetical protein
MQNADGTPMQAFYYQDGEANVLKSLMTDATHQEAFKQANIIPCKGPPSLTCYHQSNDVQTTFCDLKKGVVTATKEGKDVTNETLRINLAKAFDDLEQKFGSSNNKLLTSYQRSKIVHACEVISWCMCNNGYVTQEKIKRGYRVTGQHRPVPGSTPDDSSFKFSTFNVDAPDLDLATVDFELVMSKCTTPRSSAEYETLVRNVPAMVAKIRAEGRATDAYMDELGIPKLPEGQHVDRDGKVLCQQHAQVLLEHAVKRFVDYNLLKHQMTDPVQKQKHKELEDARRLLAQEEKRRMKEEQKRIERENAAEAKRLENERIAAMTDHERDEYKRKKKEAKALEKRLKEAERERKLAEANNCVRLHEAAVRRDENLARLENARRLIAEREGEEDEA